MKRKQHQTIFLLAVALLVGQMVFWHTERLFLAGICSTMVFVGGGILIAALCLAETTQE